MLEVGQAGVRVRPLGGTRAGEVRLHRFLHNPRVTAEEMVASARAHTRSRVQGRHVLAIQDTTSLRDDGRQHSLQLHPTIAVDAADGALLGLVHATFLSRDGGAKIHCNKRPLAAKESRRWLEAIGQAGELRAAGAAQVTMIADREADIYEDFACRPAGVPAGVEVLIRVHHDRVLADGRRLYACTRELAELGRVDVALPASPGRKARRAQLALRACRVEIKRPKRNRAAEAASLPPSVSLYCVTACEIDPPAGAEAIHWRLLTTHAVLTLDDAIRIIGFYRQRWIIEQMFRVMKTKGFDIEACRVAADGPFENLVAATLIAAVQVQQMVRDRDGAAARPMADVLDPADQPVVEAVGRTLEGRTERQKNPHRPGSLAYLAWVCARLGGWTGYKGKPGPVVTLQGFRRLQNIIEGWKLRRDVCMQ